ncbi:hypothetical protein DK842_21525 [Chromobacterium phragmitis]|uniref:hypothetical protein n=1 Tax=Chromobacterium phragmitis TaxID=2202141 RepID=UPI000DEC7FE6|nr:hypothetical protein [Chromobacterium phragmitis]AXE32263.1 hypothetical protein DK842_21525 [Chromobacterium phragmitis]
MNLYTHAALEIMQECHGHLRKLEHAVPAISQAEQLAAALTGAGVQTEARYGLSAGVHLKAVIKRYHRMAAIRVLHAKATDTGRVVVNENNTRFILIPASHADTNTQTIELTFEEI